jgi:hypothetical protein
MIVSGSENRHVAREQHPDHALEAPRLSEFRLAAAGSHGACSIIARNRWRLSGRRGCA